MRVRTSQGGPNGHPLSYDGRIYTRSGTTWSEQAYLKATNAGTDDSFGVSVAISGDTVVVGSHCESSNQTTITNGAVASADNSAVCAGAAYVFVF